MPWSGGNYSRSGGSTNWADDRDAGTEIEAGLHDTHDNDLASGIDNCLAKDGTNAATADLDAGNNKITNLANGTASGDAVNKAQLDGISYPTGGVLPFAGSTLPGSSGDWLLCDGSEVSRSTYSALFAVIGTTYGIGDGSTTFNLPDMQGRVIAGRQTTQSRLTTSHFGKTTGDDATALADSGGEEAHTLTIAQMSHKHPTPVGNGSSSTIRVYNRAPFGTTSGAAGTISDVTGSGGTQNPGSYANTDYPSSLNPGIQGHSNIQPTIILNYIIKT